VCVGHINPVVENCHSDSVPVATDGVTSILYERRKILHRLNPEVTAINNWLAGHLARGHSSTLYLRIGRKLEGCVCQCFRLNCAQSLKFRFNLDLGTIDPHSVNEILGIENCPRLSLNTPMDLE